MAVKRKSQSKRRSQSKRIVADVSVPLFLIAARFASKESERVNINGVRVQRHPRNGVLLIGTDGHRMMVLHDEHGSCRRSITIDAAIGAKVARAHNHSSADAETRWKVTEGRKARGEERVPLVPNPYPDWIKVVHVANKSRGGAAHTVNAKYLADFARVAGDLVPAVTPQIRVVPGKDLSDPSLILFPKAPHAFGVLMPMLEWQEASIPEFIQPLLVVK